MRKSYLVLFVLVTSLVGCLPVDSLNPFLAYKDIAFDESLLGFWVGPEGGKEGGLEFSPLVQGGQKGYVVTVYFKKRDPRDPEKMVFHGFLGQLEGRQFLDLVSEEATPEPDSYSLQIKSDQEGTRIEPHLIKVGVSSYLEFGPTEAGGNGKFQASLRPAHWLVKLIRSGKNIRFDWADDDDFRKAVQSGKIHLPSTILGEGRDQRVVITATTEELREFVLKHADDGTFFGKPTDELHRQR